MKAQQTWQTEAQQTWQTEDRKEVARGHMLFAEYTFSDPIEIRSLNEEGRRVLCELGWADWRTVREEQTALANGKRPLRLGSRFGLYLTEKGSRELIALRIWQSLKEEEMHVYPSQLREIANYQDREKAYRQAIAEECFQDNLYTRIAVGVGLSDDESKSLYELVAKGCHKKTKLSLSHTIACIPYIKSYGIFERVLIIDGLAAYCTGQSYPDEIRTLRKCLENA